MKEKTNRWGGDLWLEVCRIETFHDMSAWDMYVHPKAMWIEQANSEDVCNIVVGT